MTMLTALYIVDIFNSFRNVMPALFVLFGLVIALWFLLSAFCVENQFEWSDTTIYKCRKYLLIYPVLLIMFSFMPSENTIYTYIESKLISSDVYKCKESVEVNGNTYLV